MAQSNSNKPNICEKHPYGQKHKVDRQIPGEEWKDVFHLAAITREHLSIEKLLNKRKRHH